MRPYLAIIKDSFRAAMASRVLYVLLLLITVLLLALAPLHMQETLDWKLSRDFNVKNPEVVMRQIVNNKDSAPTSRVWELLNETTKSKMQSTIESANEIGGDDEPSQSVEEIFLQEEMIVQLNKIIEDPEFYRAEDWQNKIVPREAQEFIDSGVDQLTPVRSKRLNRLLLSKALTGIDQGNDSALLFKYAFWEFPAPLSMTHEQFAQTLTSTLPWYFEKLVLSIGLLIAIIVTANMIPETFEPGSLNLLLSKPISRWGLFVAKFVGGCVFIALCSAYLFFGLWTWLGLAMDVWDRAILISIPLYVVVFAIYFSVSSVVGLIWRSAIVSVILTLLFWAVCFTIGTVFYRFDTKMQNSELIGLLPVGEMVYPQDMLHQVLAWDAPHNQWEKLLEAGLGAEGKIQFGMNSFIVPLREIPAMPGLGNHLEPILESKESRVFASRFELGKSLTSGRKRMMVADAGVVTDGKLKFKEVGDFPPETVKIFDSKNGIIAVTSNGYFNLLNSDLFDSSLATAPEVTIEDAGQDADSSKPTKPAIVKEPTQSVSDNTSGENPAGEESTVDQLAKKANDVSLWNRIGPQSSFSVNSPNHVGYSSARDEFVIYRRGELKFFRYEKVKTTAANFGQTNTTDETPIPKQSQEDPKFAYTLHATLQLSLEFDKGMTSRMAFAGDLILIAFGNGKVITVDAEALKELNEYQPEKRSAIESVSASPDGRYFAAMYRNGNLWLLDTKNDAQMKKADVIGQGSICTFAFGADGTLWVTDNTDRATRYDLADDSMKVRHAPSGGWIEKLYRYGLKPAYQVCPKPGEFYKVVTHLSSSGNTETNVDVDMNKTTQSSDPWSPLWSGLVFMFGMLFIGCVIFHFKDY